MEYIVQTIFLFAMLFVYLLSGSAVYSFIGEGYKASPLRCFAVGVSIWVLLVLLSTVIMPVSLTALWWFYMAMTAFMLVILPKKDQQATFSLPFFYQVLTSVVVLLPVFYFLRNDDLHLWQEFAVYAKSVYSLANNDIVSSDLLSFPLAYQLAILPVSFFANVSDSIFACFNFAVLAFVACEFVRNSGIKFSVNNVAFPLISCFVLLFFLNPFSINELVLAADPFIFIGAIAFAFAEYIFRAGHLPKSLAGLAPALILVLLVFSSTQGLLLAVSLFFTLTLRYIMQASSLNYKQLMAYVMMPMLACFMALLWHYYLATKGLTNLAFDINAVNKENFTLVYNALVILFKNHVIELIYIIGLLAYGLYSFSTVKTANDLIVDKYLIKPVFWISVVYLFVCLPFFFMQYDYIARASYSLGFSSIAILQFIILMPIGRILKENKDNLDIHIPAMFKLTIIVGMFVVIFMTKDQFEQQQHFKITNVYEISQAIEEQLPESSVVAVVDLNKTVKFYKSVLDYKNKTGISYVAVDVENLPKGIKSFYKYLKDKDVEYVLLHAPNNILIKNLEYNLDPQFTYLYKLTNDGFYLEKKFENKLYKDTNILIK